MMFIQTEETPNPNSLKFVPNKMVSEIGPVEIFKKDIDKKNPLANKILALEGIVSIFFGDNFISVNKNDTQNWNELKHAIKAEINDFYNDGNEAVFKKHSKNDNEKKEENETILKIKEVLENKVRPAVARDGGDIQFKSFNDGVVTVELRGSCSGCPSSIMTLKQGVQNLLKHYIPEVKQVEAI